ncbi:nitrous oxide reductase accessory protein NosL [Candidatus Binatia bacterium]|nr:nitrous oxide reductase accessory protein NosL [Candidatus Binatia bacterium]
MNIASRILTALAALLLVTSFFFPLWRYDMGAPQYPEGLAMTIWANKVGGQLPLVNQLNHYIGMKHIEPDSMAELKIIPWVIVGLIVSGLLVAAIGRMRALVAWFVSFVVLGTAGLADFYWWLYDYGTDLSPDAPITIEPFVPPLFGTNMLANFEISSYPDTAGWAAFVAGLLAFVAVAVEWQKHRLGRQLSRARQKRKAGKAVGTHHLRPAGQMGKAIVVLLLMGAATVGCSVRPTPIDYGKDECAACRMRIVDARFGSELVTKRGKPYKFDAVECLVGFVGRQAVASDEIHSLWVGNFATPGELIDARSAAYLRTDRVRSPMGLNVLAFANNGDRDAARAQYAGEAVTWDDLPALRAALDDPEPEAAVSGARPPRS